MDPFVVAQAAQAVEEARSIVQSQAIHAGEESKRILQVQATQMVEDIQRYFQSLLKLLGQSGLYPLLNPPILFEVEWTEHGIPKLPFGLEIAIALNCMASVLVEVKLGLRSKGLRLKLSSWCQVWKVESLN